LGKVLEQPVIQRAVYYLTFFDRMTEAAALRFVAYFERVGLSAGEAAAARWAAYRGGRRAVKDAFEATEMAGEMAEGALDVLVLVGQDLPSSGGTYAARFAEKHGANTEAYLSALNRTLGDDRFSDEVLTLAGQLHAGSPLPALSQDAFEGTAYFLKNADPLPGRTAVALEEFLKGEAAVVDDSLKLLRDSDVPPEAHKGFLNILEAGLVCGSAQTGRILP